MSMPGEGTTAFLHLKRTLAALVRWKGAGDLLEITY